MFHTAALRERFSPDKILNASFNPEFEKLTPFHAMHETGYAYDDFEPYYKFFFWILSEGMQILYLKAKPFGEDPLSTILETPAGKEFLVHTWYAREYMVSPERINSVYRYAEARAGKRQ